jgi:hypothetical protein
MFLYPIYIYIRFDDKIIKGIRSYFNIKWGLQCLTPLSTLFQLYRGGFNIKGCVFK